MSQWVCWSGVSEPIENLAEGRIAALKRPKKYSRTTCTLRFFGAFRLALHPLIEILDRLSGVRDDDFGLVLTGTIEHADIADALHQFAVGGLEQCGKHFITRFAITEA